MLEIPVSGEVIYGAADTTARDPSPKIWGKIGKRRPIFSDHLGFDGLLTSTAGKYADEGGSWSSYQDSGNVISGVATDGASVSAETGLIKIAIDTDNDASILKYGGDNSVFCAFAAAKANGYKVLIEQSIAISAVTTTVNVFSGLMRYNLTSSANWVTTGDALVSTADFVGFYALAAASQTLKFGYQATGQTAQVVAATAATLVANTLIKTGIVYDPFEDPSRRITGYANGAPIGYISDTNIAAATFPSAVGMSPMLGLRANGGAINGYRDWICLYTGN